MSSLAAQTIDMINMLPEEELATVDSLLKMLIRAWDPDFSKLTASERDSLERIEESMRNGDVYSEEDVWS